MELMLNLVWAATGLAMLVAWLRMPRHEFATRTGQALCLGVAILLLLPVISLSDDLVAAQTTTETDCCVRRAPDGHSHMMHPCTCAGAAIASAIPSMMPALGESDGVIAAVEHPECAACFRLPYNRPPPKA